MANENKKDFNKMLNDNKNMPKIIKLDKKQEEKCGGKTMIIVPPLSYDEIIKKIPEKKIVTIPDIRKYIAKENNVDLTDPMTAGIFINICAWASYQRETNITPYWRILKKDGELNMKYPGGIENQKKLLEKEGHKIISKGNKNIRYFVSNYENNLYELK